MQFPIHIELRRSRLLAFSLLLVHSLAVASVVTLPWPWPWRLSLLALIGFSAWRSVRMPKILGLRLSAHGLLDCLSVGGERTAAVVLPDSAVFNRLIVLRLKIGDARSVASLALLPDSMSAEQFRLLRLWLRWRGESSESAGKGV